MATSLVEIQRNIILETVRYAGGKEWKVLVVDEASRNLIDNAVKEDDILNENVTNIEQIEHRRPMNKDMDALYILSPQPHIVDCVMADFERRRYRSFYLVWISLLDPHHRARIEKSPTARDQLAGFRILNVNFFPRESHIATFRDPWSFPVLFHPGCNHLIRDHLKDLAQKMVSICVSLGEYPTIRYYRPRTPTHEASVLCSHLARFVQEELDQYANYHEDFPPPSPRPRGVLYIVDRSMDLYTPLIHDFTYQAMAHDLLPIKEGDKIIYRTTVNEGQVNEETKDMEISEKDRIWVENRHLHMKDLLGKLGDEFNKFRADNPEFSESDASANVNTIKHMLAGLSEFQEGKNSYTLHLNMAQECMKIFQNHKLMDISSVEQCLATGLDEDYRKPKNLADQLVRLLDDDDVIPPDRLRLIILYILYRGGLLAGDIKKLLAHAQLSQQDAEMIHNLELLGSRPEKPLKDTTKPHAQSLFPKKQPPTDAFEEEESLSRFEPNLKLMLEEQIRGTLDSAVFPSTRPHLEADGTMAQDNISQASLRSAKPTWARTRPSASEPRQRIIVFMAGGATYSEARACYDLSQTASKDIYLATSHMITPRLFIRQLGDLSADKRRLYIPADRPKPKAPSHLFEREEQPRPPPTGQPQASSKGRSPGPPAAGLASMTINSGGQRPPNGSVGSFQQFPPQPQAGPGGKPHKKDKEKKKHHFFK